MNKYKIITIFLANMQGTCNRAILLYIHTDPFEDISAYFVYLFATNALIESQKLSFSLISSNRFDKPKIRAH